MSPTSPAERPNKRLRAGRSPIDAVGVDELALALTFLGWKEVVRSRVCRKFKDAAAMAFTGERAVACHVETVSDYRSLPMMARAFPDLSKLWIGSANNTLHFRDGDEPIQGHGERPPGTQQLDFDALSAFSNLRELYLCAVEANGRYPRLLSSFHGLQVLVIHLNANMKVDLSDFRHCHQMRRLFLCGDIEDQLVTGDIGILSEMQNLESISINCSPGVTGDIMQLAGSSSLSSLSLLSTGVKVNFDSIENRAFPNLKRLTASGSVTIASVDDARSAVASLYRLEKRGIRVKGTSISLRKDSPDSYRMYIVPQSNNPEEWIYPPHNIEVVRAGPRVGWRWCGGCDLSNCEINWLDPVPAQSSEDYSVYVSVMATLETTSLFKGFYDHPSEEEYREAVSNHYRSIASR